ncbi:cation:proton antiporter [Streptomyces sp. ISL-43]|uniref:cation:proton antiporter n=1 Tax=Streptomyces sp. ISL-43 TaxID=2819183 RepID=UPI001BE9F7F2|nr:cation:proton antiporter [Streptomyces sp. ISL-43]MBT2446160.1 cation:proton antiporter [Streptomyces sp. ISL-43]
MPHTVHLLGVLAAVLVAARAGRAAARWLRQPEVIGEMTAGLLAGPAVLALLGRPGFDAALPHAVLADLKTVGQAGLILFLVGLAHHLRGGAVNPGRRAVAWVTAGSLLLPLLCGTLLAVWVITQEGAEVRGQAPTAAFVLMTAVSLSISAVPVMARIISARNMHDSPAGALTMTSAVVIDTLGWLLLTLALCLSTGSMDGFVRSLTALAFAAVCALAIRRVLSSAPARDWCARAPRPAAAALGVTAIAVALGVEHLGMTAIVGAAVVGLAIPTDERSPWAGAVASVTRVGKAVVPVFFVVTGVTVFGEGLTSASWQLFALALFLGVAGKTAGGYLGARAGGITPHESRQVAVLMNTRGLTELIVLQAALATGVFTAPLALVLVCMALATTAMTGPLLHRLDRAEPAPKPLPLTPGVLS